MKRRILGVGVELEGGWNCTCGGSHGGGGADDEPCDCSSCQENRKECPCYPVGLKGDGSVERISADFVGEVASPVLKPLAVAAWVQHNYPDEVNNTCGLHVHASFRPGDYGRLLNPALQDYLQKRLTAWGRLNEIKNQAFWARLKGDNHYCRNSFDPAGQLHSGHVRYTQVNFAAWLAHKTVEIRVLPMFKQPELGVSAVLEVLDILEQFVSRNPPRWHSVRDSLELDLSQTLDIVEEI